MQDIIAEYIKKGGHCCFTADDGIDALMILKSKPMDLMILDIMMPHIDGFTVCKMAWEMSNMPIITAVSWRLLKKLVKSKIVRLNAAFTTPLLHHF